MSLNMDRLVAIGDTVVIVWLGIAFVIASLDCRLRHDRRPLPLCVTTAALLIIWIGHVVAFAGLVPALRYLAPWTLLVATWATPALLAGGLPHRPGLVRNCGVIAWAMILGFALGGLGLAMAAAAAASPLGPAVRELPLGSAAGAVGVLPVAAAGCLLLGGRRGDERVFWSVVTALVLCALASITFACAPAAQTPLWAVGRVLAWAPSVVLLAGQVSLYPTSVRAEQQVRGEREDLLRTALEASDAERRRIARDLHDSAVQDLAAVSYSLAGASRRIASEGRPELAELLDQAATATRQTIAALRSLIVEIYPPNLHKEGLAAALTDLCAPARSRGLDVRLEVDSALTVSDRTAATVYRTAQEAVRNAVKHARARELMVSLRQVDGQVQLEVADDGRGFDRAETGGDGHIGLRLLSDLARESGGRLEIRSAPGQGATVRLEMAS
jgi:signal transduction histidine kinase